MADDDIIRGGLDIVTDKKKKNYKPKAEQETAQPTAARFKKKFWNNTRQLNVPEKTTQVGGQLFGVCLPIFNFKF